MMPCVLGRAHGCGLGPLFEKKCTSVEKGEANLRVSLGEGLHSETDKADQA